MASDNYHEPYELLSEATKNLHRGIVSLMEELEAVDWYTQRAEACSDPELRAVITHHRDEEIEHAMMNLEWIRRNHPVFDENMRLYLFAAGDLTKVEAQATGGEHERGTIQKDGGQEPPAGGAGLGVGSLRPGG